MQTVLVCWQAHAARRLSGGYGFCSVAFFTPAVAVAADAVRVANSWLLEHRGAPQARVVEVVVERRGSRTRGIRIRSHDRTHSHGVDSTAPMASPLFDATTPQFVELLAACPIVAGATVSKPLLNLAEGKVVIFAMDAGQEISEHRAPFVSTVHVLDGRLRFAVESQEKDMGPHDWLLMPPQAPHRLLALEPTRFVLTLFKRGS